MPKKEIFCERCNEEIISFEESYELTKVYKNNKKRILCETCSNYLFLMITDMFVRKCCNICKKEIKDLKTCTKIIQNNHYDEGEGKIINICNDCNDIVEDTLKDPDLDNVYIDCVFNNVKYKKLKVYNHLTENPVVGIDGFEFYLSALSDFFEINNYYQNQNFPELKIIARHFSDSVKDVDADYIYTRKVKKHSKISIKELERIYKELDKICDKNKDIIERLENIEENIDDYFH